MTKKGNARHKITPWGLVLLLCVPAYADDFVDIEKIEQRLARLQTQSLTPTVAGEVARLGDETTEMVTPVVSDYVALNPDEILPTYTGALPIPQTASDTIDKRPNPIKRLYQRFFNDGADIAPNLDAKIYLTEDALAPQDVTDGQDPQKTTDPQIATTQDPQEDSAPPQADDEGILVAISDFETDTAPSVKETAIAAAADVSQQPYKNIKAAIENVSVDATPSFSNALPRLRALVDDAAKAVGYYELEFRLQNLGGGTIGVLIDRVGEPVTVTTKAVEVRGQASTLPAFNQVKTSADELLSGVFDHGKYETVKGGILALQGEKGFFDGRFLDNSVEIILPDNTADVSLVYDSGERYQFDEVVFFTTDPTTGEFTTDPAKLPVKLPLLQKLLSFAPNDGYERAKVAKLSSDLLATGYFNNTNVETVLPEGGGVTSELVAPTADDSALVSLGDDENTQVAISPIDFSPTQELLDKLQAVKEKAARLSQSPANAVLDAKDKQNQSLLGKISEQIKTIVQWVLPDDKPTEVPALAPTLAERKSAQAVAADKKIPLYVYVAADKPKEAQLGAGWGSDTGARLTARFENNLINRDGWQAGVELSVSQMDKTATAFVSRPLTHPLNDKLVANATYQAQTVKQDNNASLTSKTLQASLTRNRTLAQGLNSTYALRYRQDNVDTLGKTNLDEFPIFRQGGRHQRALLMGVGGSKISQNTPVAPTFGQRLYYSLEAGSDKLGSDIDMVIGRAGASAMLSFGDNSYGRRRANQVIGRIDGGYIWAQDFLSVPYQLRFFAGGDQSLRGYNYQSVGPKSADGYLTGGQVLALGSVEYNRELREGLRGAVFADYGGAFDKQMTNSAKLSVGVGVRYASPVGTVRVDIAKGLEKDKTPIRLHFLIGLPF